MINVMNFKIPFIFFLEKNYLNLFLKNIYFLLFKNFRFFLTKNIVFKKKIIFWVKFDFGFVLTVISDTSLKFKLFSFKQRDIGSKGMPAQCFVLFIRSSSIANFKLLSINNTGR